MTPDAADSFLTSDQWIYLWFTAAVNADEQLSNQWIQPNGQVAASGQWGRVSGNYCFTGASLYVGSLPSSALGQWEARVYNDGVFLCSVYFLVRDGGPAVVVASGATQKPVDVRDYDGLYAGVPGTGSVGYTTLFRDNEDGGVASGCNGEGCGRHPAVDIPVSWDTPVHAFADGVIATEDLAGSAQNLQGGYNSGWGGLVVIRHDSLPGTTEAVYSVYAHLNRFAPGVVPRKAGEEERSDRLQRGDWRLGWTVEREPPSFSTQSPNAKLGRSIQRRFRDDFCALVPQPCRSKPAGWRRPS